MKVKRKKQKKNLYRNLLFGCCFNIATKYNRKRHMYVLRRTHVELSGGWRVTNNKKKIYKNDNAQKSLVFPPSNQNIYNTKNNKTKKIVRRIHCKDIM